MTDITESKLKRKKEVDLVILASERYGVTLDSNAMTKKQVIERIMELESGRQMADAKAVTSEQTGFLADHRGRPRRGARSL